MIGDRPFHRCPGQCGRDVPDRLFACLGCWRELPESLRRKIQRDRPGSTAHAKAITAGYAWFRERNREARNS